MGAICSRTKALAAGSETAWAAGEALRERRGERQDQRQAARGAGEAASAGLLLVAASSAILPGGQIHPPV